ncbi:Uncharacterised protein [Mycobacteroides abscessus subsp. abscessus]|nr:Uncharacterised protein [Mycobacteroides abscessus subsp. abscessus]SHV18277.1 Uncharacterised protein [Mycobacteroides abscessus subsp. abscessus]
MPGNMPRPSGACTIPALTRLCAFIFEMSCPSKNMVPELSGTRPDMARMAVDLPAPLEPSRVTSSPSRTSNESVFTA